MKTSELVFKVELDENNLPEKIEWDSSDSDSQGLKDAKSLMLSIWDTEENFTMGIDIWTKDFTIDQMNIHFHQTLLKMADTYVRATGNQEMFDMIEDFAGRFAVKLNLLGSGEENAPEY